VNTRQAGDLIREYLRTNNLNLIQVSASAKTGEIVVTVAFASSLEPVNSAAIGKIAREHSFKVVFV
jgi:hypothetical protein